MSVLGEVLGGTHEFIHNEKTYHVNLITQDIKLKFERKLFSRAKEAMRETRELMTSEEYVEAIKRLNDDYIAGEYALESKRGLSALQTIKGMSTLCALLFDTTEGEILRLMTERKEDMQSLLKLILLESFNIQEVQVDRS